MTAKLSRRKFLVRGALGTLGVVAVGTYLFRNPMRRELLGYLNSAESPYLGSGVEPMIWFEVAKDNTIIFHSPKVEMGQGTFTGLAQIAADELGISMNQIKVVHAATATGNLDSFATGGSTSVSSLWQPLRELAATTREMLKNEAAKKLGVKASSLQIENGIFFNGNKTISFSDAAKDVIQWDIPETPKLKEISSYKFVGKPIPRIDLKAKVFGEPIFGMDATMPNMVYGAVVRPTHIGAKLKSVETLNAAKLPGVIKIVKEDDFVGVVANSYIEALNAKNAIKVEWETNSTINTADIEQMIKVGNGKPTIIQKQGNDIYNDKNVISLEFKTPIGAHAQIEPNGVVAHVVGKTATIIISTQVVALTRREVAKRLDLKEENVNVIPTYLGGGFGRRLHTPHAVQAAIMSKMVGKPVKYFFTRKEEFQHDMFRPPTHHIVKGKINSDGKITAIKHDFSSGNVAIDSAMLPHFVNTILGADIGAIRGGFCQYTAITNIRAVSWHVKLPFATSWWRSLGLLANTFAWESMMDVLAEKAEKNPLDFRIEHIKDDAAGKRLKAVINMAAKKSGYNNTPKNGRAMGFAASTDAGTPCAQVAEVSIENNLIKVHKVTCVMDPGIAVNPDQVKAQCEGAIIMGISASMHEQMFVENGQLRPTIYGPYDMALLKHAPKEIDVFLLQGINKPGAVGEPPLGPIAAAIANAVYRLIGKRLTNFPLKLS